jgi:oligoribonuclease
MKKLFWVDLEMTGLNEVTDVILEVAVIITDLDFKPLEEFHRVVFQPADVMERMDQWCKKTHGESGLTQLVPNGTPIHVVEDELLALAARHFPAAFKKDFAKKDGIVLVGNSVDNDRRFILKDMPRFSSHLHYRIIDVSSFKEIFRDKFQVEFKKKNAHRAVDDIHESIRELSTYLSYVRLS